MSIAVADAIVIALYLVGVAALGVSLRGRQAGVGDYFLGSRRMPWPLILLSIVATETSTVTFLSVPGDAFSGDLTFLQLPIGYVVGRLGVAILMMPQYFGGTVLSLYELFGRRFGPNVQRLTSMLFIVTRSVADGLRLFLTALVVEKLTGWPFAAAVVVVGVATIGYTFFGGIRAVIWTDVVQFVVYMAGAAVAAWILIDRVSGGWAEIVEMGQAENKFRMFDFRFDLTERYTFWSGLVGGAFLTAATHGADQMMVQRYLCTDSLRQARVALVASGVIVFVQFAIFLLIGVGLYAFFVQQPPAEPFAKKDEVFVTFILQQVPTGLRGLIIAAVFAAAMSTLSSSLNAVAAATVADFYKPLMRADASEEHYLGVSRGLTIAAGIAQMIVAVAAQSTEESTINNVLTVAAFTTGLTLGALVLGVLVRRANEPAAVIAILGGAATVTAVWLLTPIAWTWYALIGASSTVAWGSLASLVFRKPIEGS